MHVNDIVGRGLGSSSDGTHDRLQLLVRAGELFHQSLDLEKTLYNVARMAVESFAQLCLFDLIDEISGNLYVSVGAHYDPEIEGSLKAVVAPLLHAEDRGVHPARIVAQSGRSFFVSKFDDGEFSRHAASDEHEAFMRRMRYSSKIVVPVTAHAFVFGALTFVRTEGAPSFDLSDVQAAEELGRRAGLAVANAKQYHREQHVADTLQLAFLNDEFPRRTNLRFHAIYRGADETPVGGDWYDAFELGGEIVLTVGDVTGKGTEAARLMVQLRHWIRLAAVVSNDPAQMLELLNRAIALERKASLATAFIGVLNAESTQLRYASAGHPSPFIRRTSDDVIQLIGSELPLGAVSDPGYTSHEANVSDAALLVLYTDGLSEVGRDPVAGEQAIRTLLEDDAILHSGNPARYLQRVLDGNRALDDVAIMSLRFGENGGHWQFDVSDSAAAYAIKRKVLEAVIDALGDKADLGGCELIFGELVGNALRYAPGRLSLSLSTDEHGVLLHVMDDGPGFDGFRTLPYNVWSESGRGLFIVNAIAESLDIRHLPAYGSYIKVMLPMAKFGINSTDIAAARVKRVAP